MHRLASPSFDSLAEDEFDMWAVPELVLHNEKGERNNSGYQSRVSLSYRTLVGLVNRDPASISQRYAYALPLTDR